MCVCIEIKDKNKNITNIMPTLIFTTNCAESLFVHSAEIHPNRVFTLTFRLWMSTAWCWVVGLCLEESIVS